MAFSPDGRFVLSGGGAENGELKLWELATGRDFHRFTAPIEVVRSVAFTADGRFVVSGSAGNSEKVIKVWELATGRQVSSLKLPANGSVSMAFSPDGNLVLSGNPDKTLKLWDVATGREIRSLSRKASRLFLAELSPDGRFGLSGSEDRTLRLWNLVTGQAVRKFNAYADYEGSIAFSPDGRLALSGGCEKRDDPAQPCNRGSMKLWDVNSGKELRSFSGYASRVKAAFSPDGRFAVSGGCEEKDADADTSSCNKGSVKLWDLASGKELRRFGSRRGSVYSTGFSPDGRFVLSGGGCAPAGCNFTVGLWDAETGKELHNFGGNYLDSDLSVAVSPDGQRVLSGGQNGSDEGPGGTIRLWDAVSGKEIRSLRGHTAAVTSLKFSPDGRFALSSSLDSTIKLWEVATGGELYTFLGHVNGVNSIAYSHDGRFAFSSGDDGTARIWDIEKRREAARMMASPDEEWLAFTPEGFFSIPKHDTDMIAIVRGLEVTTIGQVHQSLFNPDLVRDALAGDPNGEVKRAAEVINLEKVLDSGPAPEVQIVAPAARSQSAVDLIEVKARIADRGKGIGRIEWRANGVTAAVANAPANAGPAFEIKQELALDPGENAIEFVAYNARNLLASLPAQTTITYTGPTNSVKPKLHILAIGINQYVDQGWTPPGGKEPLAFPPLNLAKGDAKALAAELEHAAAGQYAEVRVRTALDAEATAEGLDRIVSEMSAAIGPRDTFIFFAAAHGYSHQGRFYLIPQDYQGGPNPDALKTRAIGQDKLQDWIANRIKAKKALILLDTCESGALTNGYAHSRVDAPASEAGVGRLHEATGRPVLTAAAQGQFAHEGVIAGTGQRRGVFTWAVLDALKNGDTNGDGYIQLSELVAHVQTKVPGIAQGLARAVTQAEPVFGVQTPRFGATGEDFAVVRRLQ